MTNIDFDVVIVGSGPGGCSCALSLATTGLKVALVDKATFPRDKICGDALSADVMNQLTLLPGNLPHSFKTLQDKTPSYGVSFFAPNLSRLDIGFKQKESPVAPGYIVKRKNFDYLLLQQVKKADNVTVFEETSVIDAQHKDGYLELSTNKAPLNCKIAIGADGNHSIIAKKLKLFKLEKNHYCAGLRQYYEGVTGFNDQNFIELHFYKDLLPGYFWVFPLPGNKANVGLGMLSSAVSKHKINLKQKLKQIIGEHPNIAPRFRHAKALETVKGFGLPIGSRKRKISGERALLIGDAASLIDPFTGEGIGNAIRSGRVAAGHVIECFKKDDFSENFNKAYDKEIYKRMWKEFRVSRSMQMLLKYPRLFNFVVKKANNNPTVKTLLSGALEDTDLKAELAKPSFYIKLFTK